MGKLAGDLRNVAITADKPCPIAAVLESVDDEDRAELLRLLVPGAFMSYRLKPILKANGHEVTTLSIDEHKRRECSCRN